MFKIDDPRSWLDAPEGPQDYQNVKTWIMEGLRTGDVTAAGDIVTLDGSLLHEGAIWVTPEQATNASYYGWRITGSITSSVGVDLTKIRKGRR
jgi:hypothetical protein